MNLDGAIFSFLMIQPPVRHNCNSFSLLYCVCNVGPWLEADDKILTMVEPDENILIMVEPEVLDCGGY
jgi:hypothetical protein